jgi:GNAT superfamily N-acetyltransferase
VTLQVRPMEDEEFAAWLPLLQEGYAGDLMRDYGLSPDQARARAAAEIHRHPPEGHSVYVLEVDGASVGHLWLAERRNAHEPTLSIYDLDVDEPHRGRGYGRAAMVFAEEEARRRGLTRLALRVGTRNGVARNLYRSLGFDEHEILMSKPV